MKSIAAVVMALYLLSLCAAAYSDAEVSTESFLQSNDTAFSALRTITANYVTTPELDFRSNGRITTTVNVENGGAANIVQNSLFSGGRDASGNYRGSGSLFSSASGIGISKINSQIYFTGLCFVSNPQDNPEVKTKVESKSFGVSMASPGTSDYLFGVQSKSNVLTNAPILRVPHWMTEDPKIFTISMDLDPLQVDKPLDKVDETIKINYDLFENELYSYDYDFSRTIQNDDTTFESMMKFGKIVM
jgi:hypothetical protein